MAADARPVGRRLAFRTRGQPETYAITPDGMVAGALIGPATTHSLNTMLAAARGAGLRGVVVRRWLPWLLLGVVVIGAITWAAWPGGSTTPAERAHDLATQLKCPDCEGLWVADSNTSTRGRPDRRQKKQSRRHESDAEIRQAYVDLYGESILLSPSSSGLGFLVWGLPVAALVLGAGGLVVRAPALAAPAPPARHRRRRRARGERGDRTTP